MSALNIEEKLRPHSFLYVFDHSFYFNNAIAVVLNRPQVELRKLSPESEGNVCDAQNRVRSEANERKLDLFLVWKNSTATTYKATTVKGFEKV